MILRGLIQSFGCIEVRLYYRVNSLSLLHLQCDLCLSSRLCNAVWQRTVSKWLMWGHNPPTLKKPLMLVLQSMRCCRIWDVVRLSSWLPKHKHKPLPPSFSVTHKRHRRAEDAISKVEKELWQTALHASPPQTDINSLTHLSTSTVTRSRLPLG